MTEIRKDLEELVNSYLSLSGSGMRVENVSEDSKGLRCGIRSKGASNLDAQHFELAFNSPDILGKILRTHIEIESQINFVIEKFTAVKIGDIGEFSEKCRLLLALGWPTESVATLRRIGRLRNSFAHNKVSSNTTQSNYGLMETIIRENGLLQVKNIESYNISFSDGIRHKFLEISKEQKVVIIGMFHASFLAVAPDTHEFQGLKPQIKLQF